MFDDQLLKFVLAAAATGRGTGDAGDALRVGNAVVEQLFDLLGGGAAAVADYIVCYVGLIIGHRAGLDQAATSRYSTILVGNGICKPSSLRPWI